MRLIENSVKFKFLFQNRIAWRNNDDKTKCCSISCRYKRHFFYWYTLISIIIHEHHAFLLYFLFASSSLFSSHARPAALYNKIPYKRPISVSCLYENASRKKKNYNHTATTATGNGDFTLYRNSKYKTAETSESQLKDTQLIQAHTHLYGMK